MPYISLDDKQFILSEGETVLDCLIRHDQEISYACRSGVCQSCLVKVEQGEVDDRASAGLKDTLRADGYALACQCAPSEDLRIQLPGADVAAVEVSIYGIDRLSENVMCLRLSPVVGQEVFASRPGQYLNVINPAGVARSYSIANDLETDGYWELHIANTSHGEFTQWLFSQAEPGMVLHVRGPAGDCFYVNEQQESFPILLAGTGTGLAPLYGILHTALRAGHKGDITLLHGGLNPQRLYLLDELKRLDEQFENFRYRALVLNNEPKDDRVECGDLTLEAIESLAHDALGEQRVYLCGAPDFVHGLRRSIFMKGVKSANIFCDAFVTKPSNAVA
ncbi:MAG: 2Fe-2S iron-sulfur cluster-binding protein [Pseudohongiellaceae bacterium]|nr:2Fe-2S iron-sulfur cluster-binding protein [Pseudohongiellaceae bacterium]